MTRRPRLAVAAFAATLAVAGLAAFAQDASSSGALPIEGTTAPSEQRRLGFNLQGTVLDVSVERGAEVRQGQKLVSLDARVEQSQLNYYNLKADAAFQVAAAQAKFELAAIQLERKRQLAARNVTNELEVQEAEAAAKVAEIETKIAGRGGEEFAAQAAGQQVRVDQMAISSPIDGVVSDVLRKGGEVVREGEPVVEVVKLDPLYVELKLLDVAVARKLRKGQPMQVRYRGEEGAAWAAATVDFIAPVANAAAGTQYVRLSMPNPEGRSAGLNVEVQAP